jgi:hypothetical protein
MKNILYPAVVVSFIFLSACTSVKQIGKVNMISNRNVSNDQNYQLISSYSGGSQKEIRKSRARTIEDAIDQTVRKVPGGEYLMNVKIYLINSTYLAVEGDVWGVASERSYRGFKIGDTVTWKSSFSRGDGYHTGIIIALKDDKVCLVKSDDTESKTYEMKYDELTKIE